MRLASLTDEEIFNNELKSQRKALTYVQQKKASTKRKAKLPPPAPTFPKRTSRPLGYRTNRPQHPNSGAQNDPTQMKILERFAELLSGCADWDQNECYNLIMYFAEKIEE
jgi:hypothetical protein